MNKQEFLQALAARLAPLPASEQEKPLRFYGEIIDERMDEGMSEEEAVAALPSLDEIVAEIGMETPLPTLIGAKFRPKRPLGGWEILLIVLGFPLWFPLLAAAFAVVLALLIAGIAVVGSLAIAAFSLLAGGIYGTVWAVFHPGSVADPPLVMAGIGLFIAGLGLLALLLFKVAATEIWKAAAKGIRNYKRRLVTRRQGK